MKISAVQLNNRFCTFSQINRDRFSSLYQFNNTGASDSFTKTKDNLSFQGENNKRKSENFKVIISKNGKLEKGDFPNPNTKSFQRIAKRASLQLDHKNYVNPDIIAKSAIDLVNCFDKTYGRNGYRIISLGTSPSIIAECMEFLGSEVVYMPLSGMKTTKLDSLVPLNEMYESYPNLKIAMEYLKYKGVDKDKNKINILLDYKHTGRTLTTIGKCIGEELGITVIPTDLIGIIYQLNQKEINDDILSIRSYSRLATAMYNCEMEKISNVAHFYLDDNDNKEVEGSVVAQGKSLDEIFYEFEHFSRDDAKAYFLCAVNSMVNLKNGVKNESK